MASVPATPAAPVPTLAAAPSIVCEPGEAVRFEGLPKAAAKPGQATADPASIELWVTRTGSITIDNPLRPLTPDVTRVLQVVIGGKVATLYGPDVLSLRRGAGPAVLEGTIGGTIRWDASLNALPDTVPVLADSGDILAEFRFRACGTAPAARTLAAPKPRRTAPGRCRRARGGSRQGGRQRHHPRARQAGATGRAATRRLCPAAGGSHAAGCDPLRPVIRLTDADRVRQPTGEGPGRPIRIARQETS
ncbi:hypothetical protein ACFQWF_29900 [Methylorubrum suomiense]